MRRMDYHALTARMQQTWAAGDFNRVALGIVEASEQLVGALDVRPRERVLDVACGSGNAALVSARRHAEVRGIDYVPALVERARSRAVADGLAVTFQVGDAQELPFPDGSFDVALSVFGVIFAPDQERAAAELLRVCRPGGRIGLATWTPEGMGGDTFRVMAAHLPPPPDVKSPIRWGTAQGLRELFGDSVAIETTPRTFFQYYRDLDEMVDTFFQYFGPAVRARETVGPERFPALRADLARVFAGLNRATDNTAQVQCDYLQVIVRR